ncbi:TetR family transcriptional regulator [Streptomyces sp. NPDC002795]|uniref:TetR family transcriptional regulator n=1 Tax=Streptomyces sp. NPDC002795 TaxID=3364665 RepID=UPI0036A6160C
MAGTAVTIPTLTERRKAATRLDISRAAAELFTRDGLRATRAEDIARAAGIAPRTFYRYFATKEESVAPLLDAGAHQWAEAVREAPADLPVPAALRYAVERALAGDDPATLGWVRALLRLTGESPALRAVWSDTCRVSESTLLTILAERTGEPGPPGPAPPPPRRPVDHGGAGRGGDLGPLRRTPDGPVGPSGAGTDVPEHIDPGNQFKRLRCS